MLKKIAVVGVLAIFGYTAFKKAFFSDTSTVYDDRADSRTRTHDIDHDE